MAFSQGRLHFHHCSVGLQQHRLDCLHIIGSCIQHALRQHHELLNSHLCNIHRSACILSEVAQEVIVWVLGLNLLQCRLDASVPGLQLCEYGTKLAFRLFHSLKPAAFEPCTCSLDPAAKLLSHLQLLFRLCGGLLQCAVIRSHKIEIPKICYPGFNLPSFFAEGVDLGFLPLLLGPSLRVLRVTEHGEDSARRRDIPWNPPA
mmetsp:Transcript_2071/g.4367  ORF Transcript_2071/g.4367 Transcript_2071/m.4367 type:complete len:203 (-) Transcript_2071:1369-1977(-)